MAQRKTKQKDCKFGKQLPQAPSDFSYSSKQIKEIADWIRDGIEE